MKQLFKSAVCLLAAVFIISAAYPVSASEDTENYISLTSPVSFYGSSSTNSGGFPIVIKYQPLDIKTNPGENAGALVYACSTRDRELSYQWQCRADDSSVWQSMPGETSHKLEFINISDTMHGSQYRCLITDTFGYMAVSSTITLNIITQPAEITFEHQVIDGQKYMIASDGSYYTGWFSADGIDMYFSPQTNAAVTGYQEIDGAGYLFDANGAKYGIALNETDMNICREYVYDDKTAELYYFCKYYIFDRSGYDLRAAYDWCVHNIIYIWNDECDWTAVTWPYLTEYYYNADEDETNAWVDWEGITSDFFPQAQGYTLSQWYALDTFKWTNGTMHYGDCRAYAGIFYWAATFLGYEPEYMFGVLDNRVGAVESGAYEGYYGDHAWVDIDGYIYDPQAECSNHMDFYCLTYEEDPWDRGVNRDFGPQD